MRELVDAMHEKIVPKGVYVIREGIVILLLIVIIIIITIVIIYTIIMIIMRGYHHHRRPCHHSYKIMSDIMDPQNIFVSKLIKIIMIINMIMILMIRGAGIPLVCFCGGGVRGDQGWQGLGQVRPLHHHRHHPHPHCHHHLCLKKIMITMNQAWSWKGLW